MRQAQQWIIAGLLAMASGACQAQSAADPTPATAPPVVVHTEPEAGRTDVDPTLKEIRVTFSKQMLGGSWSWVQTSPSSFPKMAGQPSFQADQRTVVLPVALEPNHSYAIWLNSPPRENFQDQNGRKALPYLLVFSTRK